MVDCETETLTEAEVKRELRHAGARRPRRSAGIACPAPEVYVVPDGMVDIALRELGARLVIDDSPPSQVRSAA
jgi:hypothetical protein